MEQAVDPSQALPIDIAYNKLADWLVDRKKVPPDFRKKLTALRGKVSVALSQLQRSLDPGFLDLTPDCTGYLEAKHVRDVLSALPESRGLFGRSIGAAADWDAIISAYEKDLIFLGEAAQIMSQHTNYDIPYHKKQISKFQQQLSDSERKEAELKRSAAQSAAKYKEACEELGIPGLNVRAELVGLGATLPKLFAEVVGVLCSDQIGSALGYYQAFSAHAHAHGGQEDDLVHVLPTLTELRTNPPDVDAEIIATSSDTQAHHQNGIQTGSETDANTAEIDWGVETAEVDPSIPVDIDWDIGALEVDVQDNSDPVEQDLIQDASNERNHPIVNGHEGEVKSIPEISWDVEMPAEIDWDIDVEEDGSAPVLLDSVKLSVGMESNGPEKPGVLQAASTNWFGKIENRTSLLDDLFELKIFLKQRLLEIESKETAGIRSLVGVVLPSSVPQHESESLVAMETCVRQAVNIITNRRTRDLILIATSVGHLNRLEGSLTQKKQSELKLQSSIADLNIKRLEYRQGQALLWPKQEALVARTQHIKENVEKFLSTQYNGRRVNIVGEINTILGRV